MNASASPASYEFKEEQNLLIRNLATRVKLLGLVVLLQGLATIAVVLFSVSKFDQAPAMIGSLGLAVLYQILLGLPLVGAARALGQIVETSQNDVAHLMEALGTLERAFFLNCIVVVALLVVQLLLPAFQIPLQS